MLFSISSTALSYGASKLFQIITPLGAYIFFRELPFRQALLRRIARTFNPGAGPKEEQQLVRSYEDFFDRALGFMTWKIGCDLGFFLVATGVGAWERGFTWAGLIPYTITQYLIYYLIGQSMILDGQINPFQPKPKVKRIKGRPPVWRQWFSKYFYENVNITSYNIEIRRVILKPFVDYGGIITSWPLYTVGLLFLQSGEINFAPVLHFFFLKMLAFYLVNTFGFILGFNFGEIVYFKGLDLVESAEQWSREQIRQSHLSHEKLTSHETPNPKFNSNGMTLACSIQELQHHWVRFKHVQLWRIQPFLERYNLNLRWLICSSLGVFFVVILEPSFANAIFSVSDSVQYTWFNLFGQMDQTSLQQVMETGRSASPFDSDELLTRFPDLWNQLFFPTTET